MTCAHCDEMIQSRPRDIRTHDCHSIRAMHITRTQIYAQQVQVRRRTVCRTGTGNSQLAADHAVNFTTLTKYSQTHVHQLVTCCGCYFRLHPSTSLFPAQVHSPESSKAVRSGSRPGSNIPIFEAEIPTIVKAPTGPLWQRSKGRFFTTFSFHEKEP